MATIKSYTDLEQSKKLAKILQHESADLKWFLWMEEPDSLESPSFGYSKIAAETYKDTKAVYLPCWSLAALFKVISNIFKYNLDYNGTSFILMVGDFEVSNKTAVDACVAMIEHLHELKML